METSKIENILGHSDISGPRVKQDNPKTDPWNFDWVKFNSLLSQVIGKEKMEQMKFVGPNTKL